MANTLGSLIVRLGLDAAEFVSGLNKAEYNAKKTAAVIDRELAAAGRTLGLGLAAAGGAALLMAKNIIADASALDDLADSTGSTVENLSRLANQAQISGTSFDTLQGLVLKLTAGMAGADDESSNVGRALKALGVTAADPAEALQQVAVSLDKYADGVGKAAIARDLFGKNGPAFLATLKDIAAMQDVQATTTTKQAAEAEKLEQAVRRMGVEFVAFKNIVLSEAVPALTRFIEEAQEGIRIFGGFGSAVLNIGIGIDPFKSVRESIADIDQRIADITSKQGLEGRWAESLGVSDRIIDGLRKRREFLLFQERQRAGAFASSLGDLGDQVSRATGRKPTLDYAAKPGPAGKMIADEFARAMEGVAKSTAVAQAELDALMAGTGELTQAQKALAGIMADKVWATYTDPERASLKVLYERYDAVLRATDAEKKRREEFEKSIDAMQKQADAEVKARDAVRQSVSGYAEQNDIMRRQIEIIGQDQVARDKLGAAIEYERLRKEAVAALDLASVANLDKEYQARLKLIDAMDLANKALEEQAKMKQFADSIGDAFASAAEEAIVFGKSAKDVLKGLEQDLLRIITRKLVTEPLGDAISGLLGGKSGGGGIIGSLLALLGGGGGSSPGWTSGGDLPSGLAGGTRNWRGGMALVGERGPELVNLPRGAQVIPNHALSARREARGTIVNQYITNMPGVTRQSASQSAGESSRRLQQHYARDS